MFTQITVNFNYNIGDKIFYSLKALVNYITANIDHIQCIFFKPEEKKENNDY